MTFTAASTYGADGYIILQTTGAVAPTNSGVSDASNPASLSLPGGTTLVTTISNNATTSYSSTGLNGSTQYSYALIPFNWNATNNETYNYKTDGSIPTCNATTLYAPSTEGYQISGNIVNNGTIVHSNDENFLTMTGASNSISGTGNYTDVKLNVNGTISFNGTINSGSFLETYINGTKSLTIESDKIFINKDLTNIGTLNLNLNSTLKNSGDFISSGDMIADATSTVEFNGSIAQSVFSSGDLFGNVVINNSVSPSSSDGIVLGDAMNLNSSSALTLTDGIVICNGNILKVNNSASNAIIAGASNSNFDNSWIFGSSTTSCLRKYIADNTDTYIFPVGIADRSNKAELINNSLTDGGSFYIDAWFNDSPVNPNTSFASLTEGGTSYSGVHSDGVWVLDHSGNINGTYDLKLFFNGAFVGLEDNKFSILSRPTGSSSGADWTMAGTLSNTAVADGYAYRKALNTFSEKAAGISDAALPVELLSFSAECEYDNTKLSWSTGSETNNNYFVVERSIDMVNYTELDKIDGAGNYNGILNYSFLDVDNLPSIKYYRIKQVDYDGRFEYFGPVSSNCDNFKGETESISSFINSENEVQINIFVPSSKNYSIKLYDKLGNLLIDENFNAIEGSNTYKINGHQFASGVYSISIISSQTFFSKKMFIR